MSGCLNLGFILREPWYGRFRTIRTVIFMIAGKLDFSRINPYVTA